MMMRAVRFAISVLLMASFWSVALAQVAPQTTASLTQTVPTAASPKTLAEANSLNTTDGWTAAKLADGRPVALYRDASVTPAKQIALGCGATGKIVAVGGPEKFVGFGDSPDDLLGIVSLSDEPNSSYGGTELIYRLTGDPANDHHSIFVGQAKIPKRLDKQEPLTAVKDYCDQLRYKQNATIIDRDYDTFMHWYYYDDNPDRLAFGQTEGEGYDRVVILCREKALTVLVHSAPENAKNDEASRLTIKFPNYSLKFKTKIWVNQDDPDEKFAQIKVSSVSILLDSFAANETLQFEQPNAKTIVVPALGLSTLLKDHFTTCR